LLSIVEGAYGRVGPKEDRERRLYENNLGIAERGRKPDGAGEETIRESGGIKEHFSKRDAFNRITKSDLRLDEQIPEGS
jgi:hypothetical protein